MDHSNAQSAVFARAAGVLCERWTPLVIRALLPGAMRFNALHRDVPDISTSLLVQRLRHLEAAGIVHRTTVGKVCEYGLTPAGDELGPIIDALDSWGARWAALTPLAEYGACSAPNVSHRSQ